MVRGVIVGVRGGEDYVLGPGVAVPMAIVLTPVLGCLVTLLVLLNKRARERERMLRRDPLTGLGNRVQLGELFERWLRDAPAEPPSSGPALLLVDLDGFKDVNDTLGHAAGDIVLVQVAQQLVAAAGPDRHGDPAGRGRVRHLLPAAGRRRLPDEPGQADPRHPLDHRLQRPRRAARRPGQHRRRPRARPTAPR